jgi:hypothetical protein
LSRAAKPSRARVHRAVVGGEVGGQGVDQLFGFGRGAGAQQREREVELEPGLVRFRLDRLAQAHHFGVRIDRRSGGFVRHVRRIRRRLHADLFQDLAQFAFGQRARDRAEHLPVLDQHHGRHRTDLERRGEFLFLVDIDLGDEEGAGVFGGELLEDRAEGLARPAPGRPEIHQHRHLQGALDDVGFERGGGGVEDVRGGGVGVGHGGAGVWGRRGTGNMGARRRGCKPALSRGAA